MCFFVLCGFEHSIANLYYIPAGLFAPQNPVYAELAEHIFQADLPALTWGGCLKNLIAVTLGNTAGGVAWALCFGPASVPLRRKITDSKSKKSWENSQDFFHHLISEMTSQIFEKILHAGSKSSSEQSPPHRCR